MAGKRGKKKLTVQIPDTDPTVVARDTAMFKDWIGGMKLDAIGEKYEMSYENVRRIATKYNWKALRRELVERSFTQMMEDMTAFSADILSAFYTDFKMIMEECKKEKRKLTGDERGHLRSLWDRMLKEKRLDEGKPTEVGMGPVQVELVLPNGVQHVGVIPVPKSNITAVQKKPEDVVPKLDLDSIEEDSNNE